MGALIGIPLNPDLSEWLFFTGKMFFHLVWNKYKAKVTIQDVFDLSAGEQYRQHIRRGGYVPC